MNGSAPNLLIIGVSTRAAAFSAKRAGLRPICLDLYADTDLRANAVVHRIENYPESLLDTLKAMPRFPLLYVGGLENQVEVLKVAAEYHDLLGNTAEVVALARNPAKLAESVRMAQAEMPEWCSAEEPPPLDGTWILRPLFGSGGRGIQVWKDSALTSSVLQEPHGFQRKIEGTSYSGVFIAPDQVGDVRFVGVTEQLIGSSESHAAPFQWSGNIGPTTLSVGIEHKMRRVGNILKWKVGLKGLFGVDFIVTDDEKVFVTEVNPRYPASAELLEFATGQLLIAKHLRCFTEIDDPPAWHPVAQGPFYGKAIFYAPQDFALKLDLSAEIRDYSEFPVLADIPEQGTHFRKGEPVCTLFAQGQSVEDCRSTISTSLQELRERLLDSP